MPNVKCRAVLAGFGQCGTVYTECGAVLGSDVHWAVLGSVGLSEMLYAECGTVLVHLAQCKM